MYVYIFESLNKGGGAGCARDVVLVQPMYINNFLNGIRITNPIQRYSFFFSQALSFFSLALLLTLLTSLHLLVLCFLLSTVSYVTPVSLSLHPSLLCPVGVKSY